MAELTWFQAWALGIIHIGVACFGAMIGIWLADRSLRKHSDREEEQNRTSHPNWWE